MYRALKRAWSWAKRSISWTCLRTGRARLYELSGVSQPFWKDTMHINHLHFIFRSEAELDTSRADGRKRRVIVTLCLEPVSFLSKYGEITISSFDLTVSFTYTASARSRGKATWPQTATLRILFLWTHTGVIHFDNDQFSRQNHRDYHARVSFLTFMVTLSLVLTT